MPASPDPRRAELERLLEARAAHPVDGREATAVAAFRAALARLERPFDEEADPTHVTSSAVVIGPLGVLLHRHKRLGIWLQPGGHLEAGEDLAAGAVREVVEETGLTPRHPDGGPRMVHVDVHEGGRGHVHLDLRWLLFAEGPPRPGDGESRDVVWFSWAAAADRADPGLASAVQGLRLIFGGTET